MNTELKASLDRVSGVLDLVKDLIASSVKPETLEGISGDMQRLREALTQRPAAQTEQGAFETADDWLKATGRTEQAGCSAAQLNLLRIGFNAGRARTPQADPRNPGWCVGCNPDNCIGCGVGLNESKQVPPEPVYQLQSGDGKWIDQTRASYEYNAKHGNTVRVLYPRPATDVPEGFSLLLERAQRLVEFADFKLGGTLSAESDLREIPSKAGSWVKTRHLAALRDSVRALSEAGGGDTPYTYASKQATTCACCGEHKHTPLRIDSMGGYVCLTCIDKKLGSLLGEFGYEDDGLYFVQDTRSFVGNCPLWWKPNGDGYTTNLDEAGKFTREAAMKLHSNRDTDLPWLCSDINRLLRATIDAQYLPRSNEEQAEALAKGDA